MNAQDLKLELELMMSRNLGILENDAVQMTPAGRRVLDIRDVRDLLRSIAANLAQAYAGRIVDTDTKKEAANDR